MNKTTESIGENFLTWADTYFESERRKQFADFLSKYPNERKYFNYTRFITMLKDYHIIKASNIYPQTISNNNFNPENNMQTNVNKRVILSPKALDFIEVLREDDNMGIYSQIEVMESLLIELIRDEDMGEDKNKLYMRYLADVIELTRLLLPE